MRKVLSELASRWDSEDCKGYFDNSKQSKPVIPAEAGIQTTI